ncbi:class I SAM-dependent methyltransferase [Dactylosporangium sp. CA-139114]|uniref:class I SAM-dependent methyltransferase n=1 Tax=Dactylosporangium sp. CA-139114 TaxID=3239931 RepID=UPI003D993954
MTPPSQPRTAPDAGRERDEIVAYYTERYREDLRLDRRPQARLERARTLQLLGELLPPPGASVLDVGGGTGAYARELVAAGYRVRVVDLVPAHVEQVRGGDPPIEAEVGDARALRFGDGEYDAALLLGPLYHLGERADRVAALREAVRVTRPGGRVAAAVISRFAGPLDLAATDRFDARVLAEARTLLTDGRNDPASGFTHAYFHRPEEILGECADAGLTGIALHGLEGPLWTAAEAAAGGPAADAVYAAALELARLYSTEPSLVAASGHLLATGLAP